MVVKELAHTLSKGNPLVNALGKGGPLSTAYKRKQYFKEAFKVVEPIEFVPITCSIYIYIYFTNTC